MEDNYFKTHNAKNCNGCGICALKCPKQCIKMVEDKEGFIYPVIDESKCIHCNNCVNICSNVKVENKYEKKAYAVINKNDSVRNNSTSGGFFSILAEYTIEKNGVVFGVYYNENLEVIHGYAQTMEEYKKFRGAKYVRSDTKETFKEAEEFLKDNKLVLFSGTPCQISALIKYLQKDYENLITCNIVCHANPSPLVFKNYIKELENQRGKKIVDIKFRSKENGWRNSKPIIYYEDGTKEEEDTFHQAFSKEIINRPSCYDCKFAIDPTVGDFTIGDFWGVEEILKEMDDEKGTSIVLINSDKASVIFERIKDSIKYETVDFKKALLKNHNKPIRENIYRKKFFYKMNKTNSTNKYLKKYYKRQIVMNKLKKRFKIL